MRKQITANRETSNCNKQQTALIAQKLNQSEREYATTRGNWRKQDGPRERQEKTRKKQATEPRGTPEKPKKMDN
jgi:hypothetical protein